MSHEAARRILVVDDNPEIRRLMRLTLEDSYEVLEAENGAGALALVQQHRPELVILDVMLPGSLDGLTLLQHIKGSSETAGTLVLMASARGQASDVERGMEKGADAYFVKPFSPLELLRWVRDRLG